MLDRIQQVTGSCFPWGLEAHTESGLKLFLTAEGELVLLFGRHFKQNMGISKTRALLSAVTTGVGCALQMVLCGCVTVTNPAVSLSVLPSSAPGFPFPCSGVNLGTFWCSVTWWVFGSGCAALELTPVCLQLDCSTYELERLHTKVTSLCNRIEQLQCHNAKDRLAQSGMVTSLSSSSLQQPG